MADQFTFDEEYQNLILACLVKHPELFLSYGDILKASHFQSLHATVVAKAVLKYMSVNGGVPTWPVVRQIAKEEAKKAADIVDASQISDYIDKISALDTRDKDTVSASVVQFARERSIVAAFHKASEMYKEAKHNVEGGKFLKLFEDALAVGTNIDDLGIVLHRDYEDVLKKVTEVSYGTMTGYPQFDAIWRRGWGPGWLIVPLAPPKRYKTLVSANIALSVAGPTIKGDVLYYSCEITPELATTRMLQNLVRKGTDFLYDCPEKFIEEAHESVHRNIGGYMVVKGYAVGEATVGGTIRNHARTVVRQYDLKPKLIVIDYADTVRPLLNVKEEHLNQGQIYKEARALGAEFKCPVIMPDRVTREAAEAVVPSMKAFQGAYAKGGIVDVAFGLCMTEKEYANNVIRTFVFINRHGPACDYFRGKVDPETMRYDVGEKIVYDPDATEDEKPRRRSRSSLPSELE